MRQWVLNKLEFRDYAQNMTNPAILLVVNNVIPLLIGPELRAPITLIMYHLGEGTCYGERTRTSYRAQGRPIC